jgi:hypothetical protein
LESAGWAHADDAYPQATDRRVRRHIGMRQWRKLANDLRLDPEAVLSRVIQLAGMMPDHTAAMRQRVETEGLDHPLIERLAAAIGARASRCAGSPMG